MSKKMVHSLIRRIWGAFRKSDMEGAKHNVIEDHQSLQKKAMPRVPHLHLKECAPETHLNALLSMNQSYV